MSLKLPSASASQSGIIDTGTQTIAGAKTFNARMSVNYSAGASGFSQVNNDAGGADAFQVEIESKGTNTVAGVGGGIKLWISGETQCVTGYRWIRCYDGAGGVARGGLSTDSSGNVTSDFPSDQRLKTNIRPFVNSVQLINQLQVREFEWIRNGSSEIGLVAQEVAAVFPDAVIGDENSNPDENPMSILPTKFIPLLLRAVQELSAKNDALEARIAALENA